MPPLRGAACRFAVPAGVRRVPLLPLSPRRGWRGTERLVPLPGWPWVLFRGPLFRREPDKMKASPRDAVSPVEKPALQVPLAGGSSLDHLALPRCKVASLETPRFRFSGQRSPLL